MPVRLYKDRTSITASSDDLDRLRGQFGRHHAVLLRGLLDPALLAFVQRQIEADGFHERVHDLIPDRPVDLALNDGRASALLALILNDHSFLAFVRHVTGLKDIQSFTASVNRRLANARHEGAWHNDLTDGRVAALTVNVSVEPCRCGILQIRDVRDHRIVYEQETIEPGDATLFKLDERLQHRVTQPEGDTVRTACAGWFRTEPVARLFKLRAVNRRDAAGSMTEALREQMKKEPDVGHDAERLR